MSLSNNGFHALLSLFAADYSIDSAALDLYIGYQYLSPEIDLNRHRTKARGRALGDFDLLFTGRSHLLLGSSRERSTLRRTYCGPWKLPINVCRGLCRAGFRVSTCLDQSVLLARSRASPATCRSFQPLLSCDDCFADRECSISPHVGLSNSACLDSGEGARCPMNDNKCHPGAHCLCRFVYRRRS